MAADASGGGMTWPTIFTALLSGHHLGAPESGWAMDQIMSGEASAVQVAGFLMALRAKGETVEEMRGLADMMLAHASRIEVAGTTLDIVGTGGDRAHTVNISTMASLVAAASADDVQRRPGHLDPARVRKHHVGQSAHLLNGLSLGAQGHEKSSHLHRARLAAHDLVHRPPGLGGAKVVSGQQRSEDRRPGHAAA